MEDPSINRPRAESPAVKGTSRRAAVPWGRISSTALRIREPPTANRKRFVSVPSFLTPGILISLRGDETLSQRRRREPLRP
jgi:hypothetical protein